MDQVLQWVERVENPAPGWLVCDDLFNLFSQLIVFMCAHVRLCTGMCVCVLVRKVHQIIFDSFFFCLWLLIFFQNWHNVKVVAAWYEVT